jgi:hypothetical protein
MYVPLPLLLIGWVVAGVSLWLAYVAGRVEGAEAALRRLDKAGTESSD